ncbi:MAG: hypothetical protein GY928_28640 [Colwellia sp.]|nr:hypothetical protein [Colwellia sp.]
MANQGETRAFRCDNPQCGAPNYYRHPFDAHICHLCGKLNEISANMHAKMHDLMDDDEQKLAKYLYDLDKYDQNIKSQLQYQYDNVDKLEDQLRQLRTDIARNETNQRDCQNARQNEIDKVKQKRQTRETEYKSLIEQALKPFYIADKAMQIAYRRGNNRVTRKQQQQYSDKYRRRNEMFSGL